MDVAQPGGIIQCAFRSREIPGADVGYPNNSKDRDSEIRFIGGKGRGLRQFPSLLVLAAPQGGLRFQDAELPRPFRLRALKLVVPQPGLALASLQITVSKEEFRVLKSRLRVDLPLTGQPAKKKDHEATFNDNRASRPGPIRPPASLPRNPNTAINSNYGW
ncbi:MAG TPA: hypothetical protein VLT90_04570 [Terriglobales bacterium]|nr:hypothetical protein [Terriglobales bacterium]